ncbi:tetratricopeptide repeat protein [Streptomyces sp. 4N509B]|uniref:tetratricopeptide repeat protein n=1 Tax=Streptomyces sp. 4N509B TaxID=3457413 RepID=UPI003FCF911B
MTVTVEFDPRARRRRAVAAALLNATGLGLGFVYLRLWGRALRYWVVAALLVIVANALNAADAPAVWLVAYALWLLLAVFQGWRHGRAGETATIRAPRWAPLVGVLVLALAATAVVLARAVPQAELDRAETAHREGECSEAMRHYERAADTRYEFLLSPALGQARQGLAACELLLAAEDSAGSGDFTSAVVHYEDYLAGYDGAPPFAGAEARLTGLRLQEADALALQAEDSGAWEGAGGYLEAFEAYFALRADHPDSAEAGEVPGRVEGIYAARTADFDAGRFCQAVEGLRPFTEFAESFDEPEAADLDERASRALPEAVHGCGSLRYDDGRYCQAATHFNEAARMPEATDDLADQARNLALRSRFECGAGHSDDGRPCEAVPEFEAVAGSAAATRELSENAGSSLRDALFACGQTRYQDGDYGGARDTLRRLIDDYPDDGRVADAEDLLIAIDIAEISEGGEAGELPDPTEAGSGAAGVATVEIENGSSETLEILYTGPETGTTTIDACSGCAATLTLAPGAYEVVARASSDSTVIPFYGTWELDGGYAYANYFYITFF